MKNLESFESDELTIEKVLEIKEGIATANYQKLVDDREYLKQSMDGIEDPRVLYIAITTSNEIEKNLYTFDEFYNTSKLEDWLKVMKDEAKINPDKVKSSVWSYLREAIGEINRSKAHMSDPDLDPLEHEAYYRQYAMILTGKVFADVMEFHKSLGDNESVTRKYNNFLRQHDEEYSYIELTENNKKYSWVLDE